MQGTSTKLTAAAFTGAVLSLVSWVLFGADFGPNWASPPAEVLISANTVLSAVVGWAVPEKAWQVEVEDA